MTASPVTPPITRITGGVGGVAATYAAVRALADRFDAAGDRLRGWATTGARTLADPDLLESSPLSPITFAEAEERVLAATVGPDGTLAASLVYEADAILVRATIAAFEDCDRLVASSFEVLDYTAGRALGCAVATAAPYALALGIVAAPAMRLTWRDLPARTRARLDGEARDEADLAQTWVDTHPEQVQHVVASSGGLLDGLLSGLPIGVPAALGLSTFHPTVSAAAADLAGLYGPDGPPQVRRRPDLSVRLGVVPPRDLPALMRHLAETDALSPHDRPGDQGTIEVQTLTADDGRVRHVVYLPGTDDLTTTPFSQDDDVRDLATNLRLVATHDTTYTAGIEEAMGRAGIGPDDPVLLVGHSQGGMEAAAILADGSPFHVTHVVTAGAPTAQVHAFPAASHVLSLENRGDVVPLLDGHDNSDSRQQVTLQFDDHETSVASNHSLHHYVRGAAAAEASADPSVREQLASLRSHGFLGSRATATSQILQVTR